MSQTQTTITGYDSKEGTNDRGAWKVHIFKAADGREYKTFKQDVGNRAFQLVGQPVVLTYTEKPGKNPQYTDYTLSDAVAASGVAAANTGSPPPANLATTTATGSTGTAVFTAPAFTVQSGPDDRQIQIMRQSALERAIRLAAVTGAKVEKLDDLYVIADKFLDYFVNGRKVAEKVAAAPQSSSSDTALDDVGF